MASGRCIARKGRCSWQGQMRGRFHQVRHRDLAAGTPDGAEDCGRCRALCARLAHLRQNGRSRRSDRPRSTARSRQRPRSRDAARSTSCSCPRLRAGAAGGSHGHWYRRKSAHRFRHPGRSGVRYREFASRMGRTGRSPSLRDGARAGRERPVPSRLADEIGDHEYERAAAHPAPAASFSILPRSVAGRAYQVWARGEQIEADAALGACRRPACTTRSSAGAE